MKGLNIARAAKNRDNGARQEVGDGGW